jgi:hypothetical protein
MLSAIKGHDLCCQVNEWLTPCSRTACGLRTPRPLLANRSSSCCQHALWIIPVGSHPTSSGCEWVSKDLLLQAWPGKTVDRLHTVLDGHDLCPHMIQLFTAPLTSQGFRLCQQQLMQFLGIDQREAGEHPGINAVALGMALVIATQVSHFLTVDQIDRHIVAHEIDSNRKPGHARGLHHHLHCSLRYAVAGTLQELLQISWPRLQGEYRGGEMALLIEHNGFVSRLHGQI